MSFSSMQRAPQKEQSDGGKRKQNITQPPTTRKEDKRPKREECLGVGQKRFATAKLPSCSGLRA